MEQLQPWITPALVIGLFPWVRFMVRDLKDDINGRIDDLKRDTTKRFDDLKTDVNSRFSEMNQRFTSEETNQRVESLANEMNRRFDEVNRELADNRERMAKLEGSLEGFLAGRRDRDAA